MPLLTIQIACNRLQPLQSQIFALNWTQPQQRPPTQP